LLRGPTYKLHAPPTRRVHVFCPAGDGGGDGGGDGAAAAGGPPQQQPAFIPPKFPTAGAHDDGLIKPSEYLKSVVAADGDPNEPPGRSAGNAPSHRTGPELSAAVQQHRQQPLAAISVHDLHSVQLKKTPGTVKTMNGRADRQSGKLRSIILIISLTQTRLKPLKLHCNGVVNLVVRF